MKKSNLITEISRIRSMMGLVENVQLADKLYFKTGKLNDNVKSAILDITNGDNYTRLVADLYFHFTKNNNNPEGVDDSIVKLCEDFYEDLISYNKSLFPIPKNLNDFGITNDNESHVLSLAEILKEWHKLTYQWSKLPSLLKRNLNNQVKIMLYENNTSIDNLKHNYSEAYKILKDINDTIGIIPQDKLDELLPSLGKSTRTLKDVKKSFDNLKNTLSFISSDMVDKEQMLDKAQGVNADLILDKGNVVVFKINDFEAMQEMGCYSSWCFSLAGGEEYWESYAPYGFVYVIYNLNVPAEDARFLMVYLPSTDVLFMSNNQLFNDVYRGHSPVEYLKSIGVDINILRKHREKTNYYQAMDDMYGDDGYNY